MSAEKNKPSPYRVLSLDGGGMRGIITAVWLAALEERLEQPLRNHFDLICGTSTGSFLACGIASGQDAHALIKLYHSQGNLVFPAGLIRFVKLWGHLFGQSRTAHKFRQQGLRRVLQSVFTDRTLKQLQPPVLITCHDDAKDESLILTSLEIAQQKLPIWEVCMASSALPILFPPYPIKLPDRGKVYLSDGGVDNPDPAPSAIRYLADHEQASFNNRQLMVASFGSGQRADLSLMYRRLEAPTSSDTLEWMRTRVKKPFPESFLARLDCGQYYRFQTELEAGAESVHATDSSAMTELLTSAQHFLTHEGGHEKLDMLANELKTHLRAQ